MFRGPICFSFPSVDPFLWVLKCYFSCFVISFLLCLLLCFVLYFLSPIFSLFLASSNIVPFACFLLISAYSFLHLLPVSFPPPLASIHPLFPTIFPGFAHNTTFSCTQAPCLLTQQLALA